MVDPGFGKEDQLHVPFSVNNIKGGGGVQSATVWHKSLC